MKIHKINRFKILYLIIFVFSLSACSNNLPSVIYHNSPVNQAGEKIDLTTTPFLPLEITEAPPEDEPSVLRLSFSEGYRQLVNNLNLKSEFVDPGENPDCIFGTDYSGDPNVEWVLTLVAPFNTLIDGFSGESFENYLLKSEPLIQPFSQIVMPKFVLDVLEQKYSQKFNQIIVVNLEDIPAYIYANPNTLGIVPFDNLIPAYKVLKINQISPYDQDFNVNDYILSVQLGLICSADIDPGLLDSTPYWTNWDSEKFTSVLLTGTTALTRAIGHKMEVNGNQYPGEKIKVWFDAADISHISNEVSYYDGCPPADPNQQDLLFCGRSEYVELFTYLGIDVIELTGNHLTDKGVPPLTEMMALFDSLNIPYYAAGENANAASQALYFEHNGNRIAFVGCNAAGPSFVYATEYRAGVNPCDMEQMAVKVNQIVEEGYLPIVTFQYWESYQFDPMPWQRTDSRQMVTNGAVIVSGSQAHMPMTMEVYQNGFIHYGLGNMFFDQMDIPVVGTRREFADRHIFYNGQYLGVELLTAMLEDYAQPRPMTEEERKSLLGDAFVGFLYE